MRCKHVVGGLVRKVTTYQRMSKYNGLQTVRRGRYVYVCKLCRKEFTKSNKPKSA